MNLPVGVGRIVFRLKFFVLNKVPYDLIIGAPTLVQIITRIDMYHQTVKEQKNGKSDILNLEHEPNVGDNTKDDFTTDSSAEEDMQRIRTRKMKWISC